MSQMTIALIILVATVVLFIWEPWPIIVTAIGASIVFAYTGIITVNDIKTISKVVSAIDDNINRYHYSRELAEYLYLLNLYNNIFKITIS